MKKNKLKRIIARWLLIKIFESEDTLIGWLIGTKYDNWDITVKRNKYPGCEVIENDE